MFLYVVSQTINWLINLYMFAIVIFAALSWFPRAANSRFGRWVESIVAPYLNIFRRFIPAVFGIDFSPMIAIFVLIIADNLLISIVNHI